MQIPPVVVLPFSQPVLSGEGRRLLGSLPRTAWNSLWKRWHRWGASRGQGTETSTGVLLQDEEDGAKVSRLQESLAYIWVQVALGRCRVQVSSGRICGLQAGKEVPGPPPAVGWGGMTGRGAGVWEESGASAEG